MNIPVDERSELGKLAMRLGFRSTGDFLRALVMKGLEHHDPVAASRVRDIRRRYYGGAMLGIFLLTLVMGHADLRRPNRRLRIEEAAEIEEA
jgi:hypothetical protein